MNKIRNIVAGSLLMVAAAFSMAHGSGEYWNAGVQPVGHSIGAATNKYTKVEWCHVTCAAGRCVFGLRTYAAWTTGPIASGHIYPVPVTGSGVTIPINQIFYNGVSTSSITGTTTSYCRYTK